MMRLAATFLLLSASAALAACDSDPDPAPAPIAGVWHITRTVHLTEGTDCPTLSVGDFRLVVSPGETSPVTLVDNTLFENGDQVEVTPTHVSFETEEFAFTENQNPVLIAHDLDLVGDQLVGMGAATGDGEYLDCRWSLELVGTREDLPCKHGDGCAL